jgi:ligand-binding SRPBCC domain-containing protein
MKVFVFKSKQVLPVKIKDAWNFFSNPYNLKEITPQWLNFKVLNEVPQSMEKGLVIKYKVTPLLGIPLKWITEISEVNKPFSFTDEQKKGPYKLWRHKHIFKEAEGGTEMSDIVEYAIPVEITAALINKYIVSKKVKEIFVYRKNILRKKFG